MTIKLERVTNEQLEQLHKLATFIYPIYFGAYWSESGLKDYLNEQFGLVSLENQLNNPNIEYYLLRFDNKEAGFIKLHFEKSLSGFENYPSCDLEKMYLHPEFRNRGIGKQVLRKIKNICLKRQLEILYLCVHDSNTDAIAFYRKCGFLFYKKSQFPYKELAENKRGLDFMFLKLAS